MKGLRILRFIKLQPFRHEITGFWVDSARGTESLVRLVTQTDHKSCWPLYCIVQRSENNTIYIVICIGNSMVSRAIWKKHARVSFSKTIEIARVRRTSAIWRLWKTHECMFFQIARETILLLVNNIHEKI